MIDYRFAPLVSAAALAFVGMFQTGLAAAELRTSTVEYKHGDAVLEYAQVLKCQH